LTSKRQAVPVGHGPPHAFGLLQDGSVVVVVVVVLVVVGP
jgi:hypothetical protein